MELAIAGTRAEQVAQSKARVNIQKAVGQRLEDQLTKHTLISRFDGFVTAEFAERGQWVNQGDPVVEVSALNQVDIIVSIVEQHVPFVQVGDEVPVNLAAVPDRLFDGTVVAVVPKGDDRTRTFPVKIRVENPIVNGQPQLKAGMLANVSLATGRPRPGLLVPKDAIVLGGPSTVVFVVKRVGEKGSLERVEMVPVQLGLADQDWIQVQGPLAAGDRVVVQGNERLRPGQNVNVARTITTAVGRVDVDDKDPET